MMKQWKHGVVERFSRGAKQYDTACSIQDMAAQRLATYLPHKDMIRSVLEVGCGTGLFTAHLVEKYPLADIFATDISPAMVAQTQERHLHIRTAVMDADAPYGGPYDLIVSNMAAHWFTRGLEPLCELLTPQGILLYSMPIEPSLAQWRKILESLDIPVGLMDFPAPYGEVLECASYTIDHGDGLSFLRSLKRTGTTQPRPDYTPISALRRAAKAFDGSIEWVIAYGRMGR